MEELVRDLERIAYALAHIEDQLDRIATALEKRAAPEPQEVVPVPNKPRFFGEE